MTQQIINVGAAPNDGQGDPIRTAFTKCNNNFDELYARVQVDPPPTLVGSIGDVAGMTAYDEDFYYYCFQDFDGSSQIWNKVPNTGNAQVTLLTASGNIVSNGNVSADYFIGDGSQLTNVIAGAPTSLVNGTSNIVIASSGNITVNVAGQSLATITTTANALSSTVGMIIDGFLFARSGANSTGNIVGSNIRATSGNIVAGGTGTGGYIIGNNITANSAVSTSNLSITGNVTSNLNTSLNATIGGNLTVVGNVTSTGYFVGDGGLLSNVTAVSNVAVTQIANGTSVLAVSGSGGDITVQVGGVANVAVFKSTGVNLANTVVGNIFTDGYYYANGSPFAGGGAGNYGNSNVAAYLPTYTGNLSPGNLDVQTAFYIGGTAFTRTLTVGTRSSPVTVPLATNNSFNVLARTGNVSIYTT